MPSSVALGLGMGMARGSLTPIVPASPSLSTVEIDPSSVATEGTILVTITARDASGNPLEGRSVSLVLSPAESGDVSGSDATDGSGVATRTITAAQVGTGNTVTVTVDGVTLDDVPVFDVTVPAVVSLLTSSITPDAFAFPADGTPNPVTLVTKNAAGVALPGIEAEVTLTPKMVSASLSLVAVSTALIPDDGTTACQCSIQVLYVDGAPVRGLPAAYVELLVSGGGVTITQPSGVTDVDGAITGSFVATDPGDKVVSFVVRDLPITQTQPVTVSDSGAGGGGEIDPGTGDTVLYDDDFDGISTVAGLRTALAAKVSGGAPYAQFVGPVAGSEKEATDSMVAPGYDGSSHAYRITTNFATQQEPSMYSEIVRDFGESWATNPPGSMLFVDWWFRADITNLLWMKGFEGFNSSDRIQAGPYNSSAALGPWNAHSNSNNREAYMHLENGAADAPPVGVRRWSDVNDGDWHRLTVAFLPNGTPGGTTGIFRIYVDGYKVVDISQFGLDNGWLVDRISGVSASSTSPYPGNVGEKYTSVTGLQTLQGLTNLAVTGRLIFAGIFRGLTASGGGTFDTGRVRLWYRP